MQYDNDYDDDDDKDDNNDDIKRSSVCKSNENILFDSELLIRRVKA